MMRKTIRRTMSTSTIKACQLEIKEGKPEVKNLEPVVMSGNVSELEAKKQLNKLYGKSANISILDIEVKEDVYEISVEDFMKHATKIVDENSSKPEEKKVATNPATANAKPVTTNTANKEAVKTNK